MSVGTWLAAGLAAGVALSVSIAGAADVKLARVEVSAVGTEPTGPAAAGDGLRLPRTVSDGDATLYRRIFALQRRGDWKSADQLIAGLEDRLLMGHALAQRYLHPTAYRTSYQELVDWLDAYADHPDAARLYKFAGKRRPAGVAAPKKPAGRLSGGPERLAATPGMPKGDALSPEMHPS